MKTTLRTWGLILPFAAALLYAAPLFARADSAIAWGANSFRQLGDGTTTDHYSPMPVSSLINGVTDVAAGFSHSVAIQNGGVYAWGTIAGVGVGDGTHLPRSTPVAISGLNSGVDAIAGGV